MTLKLIGLDSVCVPFSFVVKIVLHDFVFQTRREACNAQIEQVNLSCRRNAVSSQFGFFVYADHFARDTESSGIFRNFYLRAVNRSRR